MMPRMLVAGLVLAVIGTPAAADRVAVPPPTTASAPAPAATPEPIAIAFVLQSGAVQLPGDTHDAGEPTFAAFQLAFDTIADAAPAGAMGALVVYGKDAIVRREIGPLATLRGDALGVPRDYEGVVVRDLAAGVRRGLAELEPLSTPNKALVIVGDGATYDLAGQAPVLTQLADRAARAGVAIHVLVYDLDLGDAQTALRYFPAARTRELGNYLDLVPMLTATVRQIAEDPRARAAAPTGAAPAAAGTSRTLAWSLLAGGLALGALGAIVLIRRRAYGGQIDRTARI